MSTVIVPLDGSADAERAIVIGQRLALRLWSDLVLCRSDWDTSYSEAAAYLDGVFDRFDLDLDAVGKVVSRYPGEGIPEIAARYRDAVICLHSHGRSGVGHAVLGSISEDAIAAATVPVFAVGPHVLQDSVDARRIGWCIDASSDVAELAPFCAEWAGRFDACVDVLTVAPEDDRPVSRFHRASREQLNDASAGLAALDVQASAHVLRELQPARCLAEHAKRVDLAALVVEKRSGTGVARDLLGSTTMNLIHQAPCPVLIPPRQIGHTAPAAAVVASTPSS